MRKGRTSSLKYLDVGLQLQWNRNHNSEVPGSQRKNENGGVDSVAVLEPVIKTCQITRRDLPGTSNFSPCSPLGPALEQKHKSLIIHVELSHFLAFGEVLDDALLYFDDSQTWLASHPGLKGRWSGKAPLVFLSLFSHLENPDLSNIDE